jgi:hypothetical protein
MSGQGQVSNTDPDYILDIVEPPSTQSLTTCDLMSQSRLPSSHPSGLVCSACPGTEAGGMTRLPPQPPTQLSPTAAIPGA